MIDWLIVASYLGAFIMVLAVLAALSLRERGRR